MPTRWLAIRLSSEINTRRWRALSLTSYFINFSTASDQPRFMFMAAR